MISDKKLLRALKKQERQLTATAISTVYVKIRLIEDTITLWRKSLKNSISEEPREEHIIAVLLKKVQTMGDESFKKIVVSRGADSEEQRKKILRVLIRAVGTELRRNPTKALKNE
jgi:hypothetical protein